MDAVAVVSPSHAALAIEHPLIPGEAETSRDIRQPIGSRMEVLVVEKRIERTALDIGSGEVALDADEPVRGELVLTTGLAAADDTAGMDFNDVSGLEEGAILVRE